MLDTVSGMFRGLCNVCVCLCECVFLSVNLSVCLCDCVCVAYSMLSGGEVRVLCGPIKTQMTEREKERERERERKHKLVNGSRA